MKSMSPSQFASHMGKLAIESAELCPLTAQIMVREGYESTQRVVGDASKLASLAPATQIEREEQGYTPNDPELRSGALAQSEYIEHGVMTPVLAEAAYGTDDPIGLFQETGTLISGGYMPARPYHAVGAAEALPFDETIVREGARFLATGDITRLRGRKS